MNDTHNFVQQEREDGMLQQLLTEYKQYKANFVENIEYHGEMSDYSKFWFYPGLRAELVCQMAWVL